jgi:ElaB/YqjD/DUF883 family membrane-anchored ribosome-binding protein
MTEKMTTDEAWRQVGRQLETLGESLAETFRSAWKRAEDQQQLQEMQSGLEAMVSKVSRAIEEAGTSPEAQQARREAERTAGSLRTAGAETWREARPHVVSALDRVNTELRKLIDRLESASGDMPDESLPGEPAGE